VTGAAVDVEAEFTALFAAHYPELLRFAVRRVGADAAPDVVADVFLVAWRRRSDLPTDAPALWLFGVAGRVVRNHLRGETRRWRLRSRLRAEAEVGAGHDPGERVRLALGTLRAAEQEILRLSEWDRLTGEEAAALVGCSPGAYRVRLHRARQRFAAALAALDASEGD
jgi:RNA polymerase sigma-70 factor (ECF subfamily)